jgi:CBS domain-containing protein
MLKLGSSKSVRISRWAGADTKVVEIASKNPVTCMMDQKVREVEHILNTRYRRLPVLDRDGKIRGVVSTTDVLRLLSGFGKRRRGVKKPADMRIKDIMSAHVLDIDMNMKLPDALVFFKKHRKGAYPLTHRRKLVGMVSEWDMVRQVRGKTGVKVSDVMVRRPLVAQERFSVSDVAKMLSMGGFRRLPVVKDGILVGVVTARDIVGYIHKNGIERDISRLRFPVRRIIKETPVSLGPDADVYEAVKIMISRKIGGLPVVEDHELVGLITERDIVDSIEF